MPVSGCLLILCFRRLRLCLRPAFAASTFSASSTASTASAASAASAASTASTPPSRMNEALIIEASD